MSAELVTTGDAKTAAVRLAVCTARLAGALEWIGSDFAANTIEKRVEAIEALGATDATGPAVRQLLELLPRIVGELGDTAELLEGITATILDDLIPALKRTAEALPKPD